MNFKNVVTIGVFNKNSEEVANNYPFKEKEDLRFVCQVLAEGARFIITYPVMKQLGMTEEELWEKAEENTINEFRCSKMSDMLGLEEPDDAPTMMVCTNTIANYGAGLIYSQKLLDNIAERMDGDFYIIPSSVHEIICIHKDVFAVNEVNALIQDINQMADCLTPEEVLSDTVYVRTANGLEKLVTDAI